MFWYEVKRTLVWLLAGVNGALLVWAIQTYRHKASLPDGFYKLLLLSPAAAALNVVLGLSFVTVGQRAPGMHIFYGSMAGLGAAAQVALSRRTRLGHKYRARPLIYGFLSLFVGLIALRAWMAA